MGNEYAPVGVSTYARIGHLRHTVDALQANSLAQESDVFFFSDAPRPGDEAKVQEVRDFIREVEGFGSVTVVERRINDRVRNNRSGMRQLLDDYGRLIWLEEDIVTAPGFLTFMNAALEFYETDDHILSICGYCPPITLPEDYREDVFALNRFSAWGFGTWKSRFDPHALASCEIHLTPNVKKKLRQQGLDAVHLVSRLQRGQIDALDIAAIYHQALTGQTTVYPQRSLVRNIGHDGSGIHCKPTDKFDHPMLWEKHDGFRMVAQVLPDSRIIKANRIFRDEGWRGWVGQFLRQIGLVRAYHALVGRQPQS